MIYPTHPYRAFPDPIPVPPPNRGDFCFVIDGKWKPYLLGAIFPLLIERTWDGADTELLKQAGDLLYAIASAKKCEAPDTTGIDVEDCEMKLRICGGKLQVCDCGVWVDVPSCDDNPGGFEPTQPGGGTDQPQPGGGSKQYCGALAGLQKWILPTPVSTGDVLLFSRLLGAANDGIELAWHCPDGWLFAAGSCFENIIYNGGTDPLMGTRHMEIVAEINGTFYDVLNVDDQGAPQPFTIPSGISNAQVTLQYNVDYGGHIYGECTFCVDVTNNQAAGWLLNQNLLIVPDHWTPAIAGISGTQSVWTSGTGWVSHACDDMLGGAGRYNIVLVDLPFDHATTLTHMDCLFDMVAGDNADGTDSYVLALEGATVHYLDTKAPVTGNNQTMAWNGSLTNIDKIRVVLNAANHNDATCPPTGHAELKHMNLAGVGVAPF